MTRKAQRVVFGAAAVVGVGLVYGLLSCTSSSTTTLYTPFTGLLISSSSLFRGRTCGEGPGQVYAYVASVSQNADAGAQPTGLPTANVYFCQHDAEFQNLPGTGPYVVQICAYDKASSLQAGVFTCSSETGTCTCDGGTCPVAAGCSEPLTWTTTCTGTQEQGDNALVVCGPLSAAGAAEETDASAVGDTGMAVDDSGVDAADSAALDTGAAETGAADSGAVADSTTADAGGPSDASADGASFADSGAMDGSPADTGQDDVNVADAAVVDAGSPDAPGGHGSATDAGLPDADAQALYAGNAPDADGGA